MPTLSCIPSCGSEGRCGAATQGLPLSRGTRPVPLGVANVAASQGQCPLLESTLTIVWLWLGFSQPVVSLSRLSLSS